MLCGRYCLVPNRDWNEEMGKPESARIGRHYDSHPSC
jgi:hypothetical protein